MLQQFYEAQSENTKLTYEKKQLEKKRAALSVKWQQHQSVCPTFCLMTASASSANDQQSLPIFDVNTRSQFATQYFAGVELAAVTNVASAAAGTRPLSAAAGNRETDGDEQRHLPGVFGTTSFLSDFEDAVSPSFALNDDGTGLLQSESSVIGVALDELLPSNDSAAAVAAATAADDANSLRMPISFDSLSSMGDDTNMFPNDVPNAGLLDMPVDADETVYPLVTEAKPSELMQEIRYCSTDFESFNNRRDDTMPSNTNLYGVEDSLASDDCELLTRRESLCGKFNAFDS
jgi:hypothetical protein